MTAEAQPKEGRETNLPATTPTTTRTQFIRAPTWSLGAAVIAITAILLRLTTSYLNVPSPTTPQKGLTCDRTSFTAILPADAAIENVAVVQEGGSYGEGAANIPYPTNPVNLPALCAVTVRVRSSATSSFRFGLFLPDKWNSRFLVVGNGGFRGGINWLDMAAGLRYGMASLSTDTGHSSGATDTAWARNQPEKKTDWGWRAIHGSTVLGKQIIRAYYGKSAAYSYFSGCSTGGRQGLKELQLFPDSFDGAFIGAPAWWTTHLNNWITYAGVTNLPASDPKHLSPSDIALLAAEVNRQCDPIDGVTDNIISDPYGCQFNYTTLLCPNHPTTDCLIPAQLTTARTLHSPYLSSNGTLLHPGLPLGSEPEWPLILSSPGNQPSPYGLNYARNFLFDDPHWNWHTFNESVIDYAEKTDPGNATADNYSALGQFARRGGKIIVYHGLADGLVPVGGTLVYLNRTISLLGRDMTDDFMRVFLIPGMGHCFGSAVGAPWYVGGAFQAVVLGGSSGVGSVPGFDLGEGESDGLVALMGWVEEGREVEEVIATGWVEGKGEGREKRQRAVCKWPGRVRWDGVRGVCEARSWRCGGQEGKEG